MTFPPVGAMFFLDWSLNSQFPVDIELVVTSQPDAAGECQLSFGGETVTAQFDDSSGELTFTVVDGTSTYNFLGYMMPYAMGNTSASVVIAGTFSSAQSGGWVASGQPLSAS